MSPATMHRRFVHPNVYDAEPIPTAAREEIERLLTSGDLFRYTCGRRCSPVAKLLEAGVRRPSWRSRYALAVAILFRSPVSCPSRRWTCRSGARVLIPAFTFAAVPSAVVHADMRAGPGAKWATITASTWPTSLSQTGRPPIAVVLISHMRGHTS